MFRPGAYENSTPDGFGVLEITGGSVAREGSPRRFVPLKRTELTGEVVGPLASLRMTQVYRYSREDRPQVVEAVYRFPLPGDAAVTAVRVHFGDVEIRTELKERPDAEAEYQEAVQHGKQALLLSRESPDTFTLRVAGIQPDQDVRVETTYVQLARAEGGGWSLQIPLTTSPRYMRSDEIGSRHSQGQPLLLLRDPGHRFSLKLELFGAGSVNSPTHPLEIARKEDHLRVTLRDGEVVPDRDCVLSWQPQQEKEHPTFHVWLHDAVASGQVYFLALVAPPAVPDPGQASPREVVLLVDRSGSMSGAKWAAADWAAKKFLSELTERDAFALGLFHSETRWLSQAVRSAHPDTIQEAIHFLESHQDSGGTELGVAIEQALFLDRATGDFARHVLVITDAEVSDAGRILRLADDEAKRELRRRISVLCIDAAPNSLLARELAARGGGVARFLTSDPQAEDISTALDEVLADWAQPVLTGLQLEINRPKAHAAGRASLGGQVDGTSRIDLADLPAGRPIWVVGRVPRGDSAELLFRVLAPPEREVKARRLDLTRSMHDQPALKALFGARRVLDLEWLIHSGYAGPELASQLGRLGYDPETILADRPAEQPKLYAENLRRDQETLLRKLLVDESLDYGLISSETAFVAVRKESGKPIEETIVVPNALPAGWSEGFASQLGFRAPTAARTVQSLSLDASALAPTSVRPSARKQAAAHDTDIGQPVRAMLTGAAGFSPQAAPPEPDFVLLFSGVPQFADGEALLFDSARSEDAGRLRDGTTLSRLRVRFPGGAPDLAAVDPGLSLLLFLEDLAQPRARVRLADLIRQGGERPLNLLRLPGQRVRILLVDPAGAWDDSAPEIGVALAAG
jgi:Ca-activated chloride channel family protein